MHFTFIFVFYSVLSPVFWQYSCYFTFYYWLFYEQFIFLNFFMPLFVCKYIKRSQFLIPIQSRLFLKCFRIRPINFSCHAGFFSLSVLPSILLSLHSRPCFCQAITSRFIRTFLLLPVSKVPLFVLQTLV